MSCAGLYKGAGNRGLTFRGYPKSLVSVLGASYTVVDAELQERSVYINSGESYYSYLSGSHLSLALTARARQQCCTRASAVECSRCRVKAQPESKTLAGRVQA